MRLRERDKQDVGVYKLLGRSDDVYQWHNPKMIRAAVYPAGRSLDPKVYGERVTDMRHMSAYLMRSARNELDLAKRDSIKAFKHGITRDYLL